PFFAGHIVLRHVQKVCRPRRSVPRARPSPPQMKRKFKMPKMLRFKGKKLRATAVRPPLRIGATTADYGDLAEPSMKLSRALLIVLLLHVVAVSGIIAFNVIKTRESSFVPAAPANAENNVADTAATPVHADATKRRPAISQREIAPRSDPNPSHSVSKDEH